MKKKPDSIALFLTQVNGHVEELSGLLSGVPQEPVDGDIIERSIVSTSMLASSASLLELDAWHQVLCAYESVLRAYRDRQMPWDERIAEFTCEIIEKEEYFVVSVEAGDVPLQDVVPSDELAALFQDVSELLEHCEAVPAPENEFAPTPACPLAPTTAELSEVPQVLGTESSGVTTAELSEVSQVLDTESRGPSREDRPLGGSISDLRYHTANLLKLWEEASWDLRAGETPPAEAIRRELFLVDFYARSMEQILKPTTNDEASPKKDSLTPVRIAIEDYAALLSVSTERCIDVNFVGEDNTLDPRLLFPLEKILQCMVSDVFLRCPDAYLRVEVTIEERRGGLFCCLRDNGNNFITDSRLDPDEHLAFYPGLREIRHTLAEMRSLLWVEPDDSDDTRFSFTLPLEPGGGRFMIFGTHEGRFAVLANQVAHPMPAAEANVQCDAIGDYITLAGNRVPLVRLGQVYSGAPMDGDHVVVVGYLEKRIAFYARAGWTLEEGKWMPSAVPPWKGLDQGVIRVDDDSKLPLVEVESLLRFYSSLVADNDNGGGSGGRVSLEPASHRGGESGEPVDSLQETVTSEVSRTRVLVVERSAALRDTFVSILSGQRFDPRVVEHLDDALEWLGEATPSVIISEFRVPSMAAKVLVDRLKSEGKHIPVIVTTAHKGENAKLLVEKLGAAGYISKPLDESEVLNRLTGLCPSDVASVPPA